VVQVIEKVVRVTLFTSASMVTSSA